MCRSWAVPLSSGVGLVGSPNGGWMTWVSTPIDERVTPFVAGYRPVVTSIIRIRERSHRPYTYEQTNRRYRDYLQQSRRFKVDAGQFFATIIV